MAFYTRCSSHSTQRSSRGFATPAVPIEEPNIPASTAPSAADPLPASSAPSLPPVLEDSTGPSTSTSPMETIPISPHDFPAIMTVVRLFATTLASFTTAYAALAERMAPTEVLVTHNNAILIQIQSHLGLPHIPHSSPAPAQASTGPPPTAAIAHGHTAPHTASLNLLEAAVAVPPPPVPPSPPVSSVVAPPTQVEDDIPPAAHT